MSYFPLTIENSMFIARTHHWLVVVKKCTNLEPISRYVVQVFIQCANIQDALIEVDILELFANEVSAKL